MEHHQNTDFLLQNIWDDLNHSMNALNNGDEIDMADLDKKVRNFCDEIRTLPEEKSAPYNQNLTEIISYLSEIIDRLSLRKEIMMRTIEENGHSLLKQ